MKFSATTGIKSHSVNDASRSFHDVMNDSDCVSGKSSPGESKSSPGCDGAVAQSNPETKTIVYSFSVSIRHDFGCKKLHFRVVIQTSIVDHNSLEHCQCAVFVHCSASVQRGQSNLNS